LCRYPVITTVNRRAYLAGLAGVSTATAGCLDAVSGSSETLRTVSVVGTEAEAFDVTADLLNGEVTPSSTAKVRLTWSNPGDEAVHVPVDSSARDSPAPLYSHRRGGSDTTGLMLVPTRYDPDKVSDGCWRADDYTGVPLDAVGTGLAAGDSFSNDYTLWTQPDGDGCLRSGTYHFGSVETESDKSAYEDDSRPNTWRVTLSVATPTN
jgi:hypothetical protein